MCPTETWYPPDGFSVLNKTCPTAYCYLQKASGTGRGGGLAVIYGSKLDLFPSAPSRTVFFWMQTTFPNDNTSHLPAS